MNAPMLVSKEFFEAALRWKDDKWVGKRLFGEKNMFRKIKAVSQFFLQAYIPFLKRNGNAVFWI